MTTYTDQKKLVDTYKANGYTVAVWNDHVCSVTKGNVTVVLEHERKD